MYAASDDRYQLRSSESGTAGKRNAGLPADGLPTICDNEQRRTNAEQRATIADRRRTVTDRRATSGGRWKRR